MIHPYNKNDIFKGELTAAERLEPARAAARHAIRNLDQFIDTLIMASNRLTDEQLELICKAAEMAFRASENCAFIGDPDHAAWPLETVRIEWRN